MANRRKLDAYQNSTKMCLSQVIPSLEGMVMDLKQTKKQRTFNIALRNEMYSDLNENIKSLRNLNSSWPANVWSKSQGISELVKDGGIVLNKLVKHVFPCSENLGMRNKRALCLRRNIRFGSYLHCRRTKRTLSHQHTSHIQDTSQCFRPIGILPCDDLFKNVLNNEQPNTMPSTELSKKTMSTNAVSKDVPNSLTTLKTLCKHVSSKSDGTTEDVENSGTATYITSMSPEYTYYRDEITPPSLLSPSSDNLSPYRVTQITRNTPLDSKLPTAYRTLTQKNPEKNKIDSNDNDTDDQSYSNTFASDDEINGTFVGASSKYRNEANVGIRQQEKGSEIEEYSLTTINNKR